MTRAVTGGQAACHSGAVTCPRNRTRRFPTTHWSVVARAGAVGGPEVRRSLEELCRAYWNPLHQYLIRRGYAPTDAEDHIQAFLAAFVSGTAIARADSGRGRFRSYLLGSLKRFLAADAERQRAYRRGGGATPASFEHAAQTGAHREQIVDLDVEFDRMWARAVLERVRDRLREEHRTRGTQGRFEFLEPYLLELDPPPHAATAARMGLAQGAVKVAVHRARRRFGELLRIEVAATVQGPADVDDEVRALLGAIEAQSNFSS